MDQLAGPWTGRDRITRPDLLRSILRMGSISNLCCTTKLGGHGPCQWSNFIVSSCGILDEQGQSCELVTPKKPQTTPSLEEEVSLRRVVSCSIEPKGSFFGNAIKLPSEPLLFSEIQSSDQSLQAPSIPSLPPHRYWCEHQQLRVFYQKLSRNLSAS